MERQRAARLCTKRISRLFSCRRCGLLLYPGNQITGKTDLTRSARLSSVLELRWEKGLFRHGNFCKTRTPSGHAWHRHHNQRYRRPGDHPRIWQLLSCHLLHSKLPERTGAASLPHGMGRCFPRLSSSARQQKAGHSLWWFKCCTHGGRSEKPKDQPQKCRFLRWRTGKNDWTFKRRFYGYLPLLLSGCRGHLFLVVLPL